MAASVQVLCPNGRRQNVKVNLNTKLLQVLEEVCQRQGFNPPEDYKLVQGKKDFDLSLSLRYANVPNNAKLELVKSKSSRKDQDVTIALQLSDGQRHLQSFQPSVKLWDILLAFEGKSSELNGVLTHVDATQTPSLHPVCIYMREEVVGAEALKAMTLKNLGLTSGKAIIRHLHRPVDASVLGEIEDKLVKEKQRIARLEELALRKTEQQQEAASMQVDQSQMMDSNTRSQLPRVSEEDQPMDVDTEGRSGGAARGPHTSLTAPPSGQTQGQRDNSAGQAPPRQAPPPQETQPTPMQELRGLNLPGVEVFTPDEFSDLTPQEQAIAQRLAARFLPQLQAAGMAPPAALSGGTDHQTAGPSQAHTQQDAGGFQNFRFPESSRGRDLISEERTRHFLETPCEREAILFDGNESLTPERSRQDRDVPDDFFDVTQNDVKMMYRDLQNTVNRLEDQPLMTASMRRERMESMFDDYERIAIRVQFPDRSVLQGLFRPREKVSALRSFVRENIANKRDSFYLYTAPPKEILKDDNITLALGKLAPAASVYYGSDQQRDAYASQQLRDRVKPRLEAERIVNRILRRDNLEAAGPSTSDSGPRHAAAAAPFGSHRMAPGGSSSSSASSSTRQSLPSGSTVPKWLKLGKK